MVRSSSHLSGITTLSVEREEFPEWLHENLKVQRDEVFQMEVTIQSHEQYNALVAYLAFRGVDVNERAPRYCERMFSDPGTRSYPGKLSSLQIQPEDPWEWTSSSSNSASGSDDDSDESDDDSEADQVLNVGIGYGWGRVKCNPNRPNEQDSSNEGEADIFFHHYAIGDPMVVKYDSLVIFKVINLYATASKYLERLCKEALKWKETFDEVVDDETPEKYKFYTCKVGVDYDWVSHGKMRSRPLSSIILTPGMKNAINLDCELFLVEDRKQWYHEHGLTYKRTYLFHGPPKTGKKSVVYALAGLYDRKVCLLDVSGEECTPKALKDVLSSLPKHCILVVENVDEISWFEKLLDTLDEMVSKDGLITVLIAKDGNQLDPSLLRLGRVDRKFEFREPGLDEISRYFSSFYPRAGSSVANKFAENVLQRPEGDAKLFTTLSQFFIYCAGEPASSACEKLDDFYRVFYPTASESTPPSAAAPRVVHI